MSHARRERAAARGHILLLGVPPVLQLRHAFTRRLTLLFHLPPPRPASHTPPPAGAAPDGEEELDAQTALDLADLGIVSPVTRESAGSLYHRELSRQVGGCEGGRERRERECAG